MHCSKHVGKWITAAALVVVGAAAAVMLSFAVTPSSTVVADEKLKPEHDQPTWEDQSLSTTQQNTNRLIHETSPYLLQHAHNPVDWYPWGEEALARAKAEDKPIFLSIGYSACHWCHVMERESFQDKAIAAYLNDHFINIKVDREERPDLDEIYMAAVQVMTGRGGWPMSVFLTPDLKPFFAGTYFPPRDFFGRPGFKTVIVSVATAWRKKRADILEQSEQITESIRQGMAPRTSGGAILDNSIFAHAIADIGKGFDFVHGGSRGAPKFPSSPAIQLLLRQHARTGDKKLLKMATLTLNKMARGGMYDQVGGGFHRYSVDEQWLVPHFEKMLYDNAQLSQAYLEAYQVTGAPFFRRVAAETLDYELRDMRDPLGGFYATEDADSEGEEGKFYVWTRDEIVSILGDEDGDLFCSYYNVYDKGNFQSQEAYHQEQNILHVTRESEAVAEEFGLSLAAFEERIGQARAKLLELRSNRVRPGLDDKVLASWNGLMISSLAQAYQILGDDRYRQAAEQAAGFVLTHMVQDGLLMRSYRGGESRHPGYLNDYAFVAMGLIDLYEATFDLKWLIEAEKLTNDMIDGFWDAADGGFFFTAATHNHLIVRTKPFYDGAEPSGNSVAALVLLRLAKLLDNADYSTKAERILTMTHELIARSRGGFPKMLCAADFYLNPPKEIAIAGVSGSADVNAFLETLHGHFMPNKVIALIDSGNGDTVDLEEKVPLLAAKALVSGKATAYVCENFTCQKPATTVDGFKKALGLSDENRGA